MHAMAKTTVKKRAAAATGTQQKRILNCIPSKEQAKDWPAERAYEARSLRAVVIPAAKDLREPWWGIGDQGSTGSCVGWASADAVLRWHMVKKGIVAQTDKLSVRYLWMAAKETDEFKNRPTTFIESDGTSLKSALDIARRYGVVLEKELPFASSKLYPGETDTFYAIASLRRIASYFSLQTGTSSALSGFRKWIATAGPILTRLDCDANWMRLGPDGVLAKYDPKTRQGGHAVAIVGYTPTSFIIRNSWGTGWGQKGFALASVAYTQAAFTEAYGVVV
jgi:hypothetical protein